MASSDLMVGLEIGTSKICVVVGEGRPDGTVKILGVGQAPSRGVRKGEIVDFETAMKAADSANDLKLRIKMESAEEIKTDGISLEEEDAGIKEFD